MRIHRLLLTAALVVALVPAQAQTSSRTPVGESVREVSTQDGRNQRIERIELQDSGSRIDEVREGGQTKSITVQPKASVPPYDVRPAGASALDNPAAAPGSAGPRTWKIFSF